MVFRARGHNSQFKIDAGTVLLPGLPTLQARGEARSEARSEARRHGNMTQTVYQLCICRSTQSSVSQSFISHFSPSCRTGRLFLAPSNSQCIADTHVCRDS